MMKASTFSAPTRPTSAAAQASDAQDKLLMTRIARQDEAALRELIEKHQAAVYGTIAKLIGDPMEAHDLAQKVFLRIYRAAPNYRATAQFKTWMFTIVRNLVLNEHRRRSGSTLLALIEPGSEFASGPGVLSCELPDTTGPNPQEALLHKEMMQRIDRAIQGLPEQQRWAVVLRRYDELSYEEIAQVIGTTVPALKSLLFRARETLRRSLREYLDL